MKNQRTRKRIGRRDFLRSAATATAGLAFSPMILAQRSARSKPGDINVALLGAGEQGQVLMSVCLKIPGIRIKAVCDIWTAYSQKRVLPMHVDESPPPYKLPVEMNKPFHQPHLENVFDAIRGKAALNCPAQVGYKRAVAVLNVNEAVQAGRKLEFQPDEFVV